MFQADRVFSQRNAQTGQIEWFFMAREGNFGPFRERNIALKEMEVFIKNCVKNNDDGGRKSGGNKTSKLSLLPMNDFAYKKR